MSYRPEPAFRHGDAEQGVTVGLDQDAGAGVGVAVAQRVAPGRGKPGGRGRVKIPHARVQGAGDVADEILLVHGLRPLSLSFAARALTARKQ